MRSQKVQSATRGSYGRCVFVRGIAASLRRSFSVGENLSRWVALAWPDLWHSVQSVMPLSTSQSAEYPRPAQRLLDRFFGNAEIFGDTAAAFARFIAMAYVDSIVGVQLTWLALLNPCVVARQKTQRFAFHPALFGAALWSHVRSRSTPAPAGAIWHVGIGCPPRLVVCCIHQLHRMVSSRPKAIASSIARSSFWRASRHRRSPLVRQCPAVIRRSVQYSSASRCARMVPAQV